MDVLRGGRFCSKFAKASKFSERAAKTRTQLLFAITLLHEFCHALANAAIENFRRPGDNLPFTKAKEPFYGDHGIAELGWALEQVVFDGVIVPLVVTHQFAPYGLRMAKFPGFWSGDVPAWELSSAKARGLWRKRDSLITVENYYRYFDQKYWDKEVRQHGIKALQLPWEVGVIHRDLRKGKMHPGEEKTTEPEAERRVLGEADLALRGWKIKTQDEQIAAAGYVTTSDEEDPSSDEEMADSSDDDDDSFDPDHNDPVLTKDQIAAMVAEMDVGEGYDDDGYDKDGLDWYGHNRAQNRVSSTQLDDRFDEDGYDEHGKDQHGISRQDKETWTYAQYAQLWGGESGEEDPMDLNDV